MSCTSVMGGEHGGLMESWVVGPGFLCSGIGLDSFCQGVFFVGSIGV